MLKLIGKSILQKIFLTLILFEVILVIFTGLFIFPKIEEGNRITAEENLKKLIIEKQKNLEYMFKYVEIEAENMSSWASEYLKHEVTPIEMMNFYNEYYVNNKRILTSKLKDGYNSEGLIYASNIHFTYNNELTMQEKKDIINTAKLETEFKKNYEKLNYIQWQYVILKNNMIRIYPISRNNINNFEYGHSFENDVYYYQSNEINNPERKPVWTNPYIDYLGLGLVITCTSPIYIDDEMVGIVAMDIDLEGVQKSISDLSIQNKGKSFLLDKQGKIIFHPDFEPTASDKGMVVNSKINSIASNNVEREAYNRMLNDANGMYEYKIDGREYVLLYEKIEELDWIIGIQVDRKAYMANYNLFNDEFNMLIILSVALMTFILIYYYKNLSRPMMKLVNDIEDMGKKYVPSFEMGNYSDEIAVLDDTFQHLKNELDIYIDNLYYKNSQLQTIFDNMPGVLSIIDKDYNVILTNNKGKESINNIERGINNRKCYEMFFNRVEKCVSCPVLTSLLTVSDCTSEIKYKSKIFGVNSYPIFNSDKTIREILVHSYDKTKDITRKLELANAEKFALIGQVSASVTHELKNNISVIKGVSYLLKDIESDCMIDQDEIRSVINDLQVSISNAENTIQCLLEFSDKNGDEYSKTNLTSVVEQILVLEKSNLNKYNIQVIKEYQDEPEINVNLNSLKFIITNLIANAVDVMKADGGEIKIRIFLNYRTNHAHIEISDTGPGVDESIKEYIFEPFVSTKTKGSGLGLWITKNQIDKINGKIYLESKKNIGAKFIVVIPVNKKEVIKHGEYKGFNC